MTNKHLSILAAITCLLASGGSPAHSQEPALSAPPQIIGITREAAKPGKTAAIQRNREAAAQSLMRAGSERISIALRSVTGPEELWFLRFYDDLEGIEKDQKDLDNNPALKSDMQKFAEQEGDLLLSKSDLTALYQKSITYRPNLDWSRIRYLDAITIHVRPGHHLEYLEMRKMAFEGHQRGGLDTHLLVYKVTAGVPGVTFFILRPLESLRAHDQLRAQGFGEPMSEQDNLKMVHLLGESVDREEEEFFQVEPRMSHVTDAWAKSNPEFWGVPGK